MQKAKVTSSLVQIDAQTELVSLQVCQESYRTVTAIRRVTTSLWTVVATIHPTLSWQREGGNRANVFESLVLSMRNQYSVFDQYFFQHY